MFPGMLAHDVLANPCSASTVARKYNVVVAIDDYWLPMLCWGSDIGRALPICLARRWLLADNWLGLRLRIRPFENPFKLGNAPRDIEWPRDLYRAIGHR